MGEFGATLMVAGSIEGQTQTLSIAVYEAVQAGQDQRALVLALLASACSFVLLLAVGGLSSKRRFA
jgi:molybdate transport system permease protein